MRAFTSNYSDLSGSTNPAGVWSPAFLGLKRALDRGEEPQNVIQALYDWLGQRNIKPSEVDNLLDLEPDVALDSLISLLSTRMSSKRLPKLYLDTLRRALQRIAAQYIVGQEKDMEARRTRLQGIQQRFKPESASEVVRHLLD
jgi:hypothetical protein